MHAARAKVRPRRFCANGRVWRPPGEKFGIGAGSRGGEGSGTGGAAARGPVFALSLVHPTTTSRRATASTSRRFILPLPSSACVRPILPNRRSAPHLSPPAYFAGVTDDASISSWNVYAPTCFTRWNMPRTSTRSPSLMADVPNVNTFTDSPWSDSLNVVYGFPRRDVRLLTSPAVPLTVTVF